MAKFKCKHFDDCPDAEEKCDTDWCDCYKLPEGACDHFWELVFPVDNWENPKWKCMTCDKTERHPIPILDIEAIEDQMKKSEKMITQEEIDAVWGNANFGPELSKMDVVKYGLLKCAGRWYQGHTSTQILYELGLITKKYTLTLRGSRCLYEFFKNDKKNI